ncbi:reactive intermediate/imine deaminase [Archangium sp. Cb G35]|uniref:RidA family protein n=1 Tax=Archangium sp. Cb G35 TaxID=1920190 RepID=UPI000935AA86|nr:RidA family protein [Archangium sp. Cb G35]OJT27479.1 reactive intermediate/imine deaminase [Archangium sp. Cb G35]
MARKTLHSDKAPKAIGPYSQAVEVGLGRMVFLSGQTPIDPATGELVQGSVKVQTARAMDNLREVLAAGGLDFSHVVRCGVFLVDMADFAEMNEVYGRYFQGTPPARTTVQVAGLPKGARVEIDCIAVVQPS